MARKNDDFQKRLLATFRVEANEHLQAMFSGLAELEKTPAGNQRLETLERVYREAHSLKGAARAVNLAEIESVCHALENVFAGLKSSLVAASPSLFDLLHKTLDALGGLLAADAQTQTEVRKPVVATLIRQLDSVASGSASGDAGNASPPPAATPALTVAEPAVTAGTESVQQTSGPGSGTIRVYTEKLDAVMRQAEELLAPRLTAGQRAAELHECRTALAVWKKERVKVAPALRAVERSFMQPAKTHGAASGRRELTRLLEYLETENALLTGLEDRLAKLERSAGRDQRMLAVMTDNLLHDVKEMHLLPFSSLLEVLPRFTREFARDQAKEAVLVIQGGEIEIDRRILEEMKDPLIHMLRNCIDHGIEMPAERERKHKPTHGTITIAISQNDSGKVEILVADDGAGIDVARVKSAACKIGIVSAEEAHKLGEQEAIALTFQSGISTNPIITDSSGRGLGLAIVREKIERLGGAIAVESRTDAGTSFRMVVPLTLATFRGILVRAGEQLFVIPAINVERVARAGLEEIRTVENRETIPLDGQPVSLVWLSDVLELSRKGAADRPVDKAQVVVLSLGLTRIAFRVEEILGEQEVLVKALGPQLARVRNVAGATALGTGQVAPVLNAPDLIKSAMKLAGAPSAHAAIEQSTDLKKQSILVVEDSITSRALLKNLLEAAGYTVATAVDGVDAYTSLKTGSFDLVVSDVEMPRMDGFDLTAKVRADKRLSELPIVLVTALESREHRERGVDAGANAYIVKSSFDQSNLLEVIGRLI